MYVKLQSTREVDRLMKVMLWMENGGDGNVMFMATSSQLLCASVSTTFVDYKDKEYEQFLWKTF